MLERVRPVAMQKWARLVLVVALFGAIGEVFWHVALQPIDPGPTCKGKRLSAASSNALRSPRHLRRSHPLPADGVRAAAAPRSSVADVPFLIEIVFR